MALVASFGALPTAAAAMLVFGQVKQVSWLTNVSALAAVQDLVGESKAVWYLPVTVAALAGLLFYRRVAAGAGRTRADICAVRHLVGSSARPLMVRIGTGYTRVRPPVRVLDPSSHGHSGRRVDRKGCRPGTSSCCGVGGCRLSCGCHAPRPNQRAGCGRAPVGTPAVCSCHRGRRPARRRACGFRFSGTDPSVSPAPSATSGAVGGQSGRAGGNLHGQTGSCRSASRAAPRLFAGVRVLSELLQDRSLPDGFCALQSWTSAFDIARLTLATRCP